MGSRHRSRGPCQDCHTLCRRRSSRPSLRGLSAYVANWWWCRRGRQLVWRGRGACGRVQWSRHGARGREGDGEPARGSGRCVVRLSYHRESAQCLAARAAAVSLCVVCCCGCGCLYWVRVLGAWAQQSPRKCSMCGSTCAAPSLAVCRDSAPVMSSFHPSPLLPPPRTSLPPFIPAFLHPCSWACPVGDAEQRARAAPATLVKYRTGLPPGWDVKWSSKKGILP